MSTNNQIPSKINGETATLSTAEFEILKLIKKGYSSIQIAQKSNRSPRTIEKHRSNIISKLRLPSTQNALYLYLIQNPDL